MSAKTDFDIAQAVAKGQLRKGHAQELIQMGECLGGIVRWISLDTPPKRVQRKKVHHLGECQLAGEHGADPGLKTPFSQIQVQVGDTPTNPVPSLCQYLTLGVLQNCRTAVMLQNLGQVHVIVTLDRHDADQYSNLPDRASPTQSRQMENVRKEASSVMTTGKYIDELYLSMLGRLPDPEARKNCIRFLKNSGTLAALAAEIEGSTEYSEWRVIKARIDANRRKIQPDAHPVSQVPEIYCPDLIPYYTFRGKFRPLALMVETINICNNDCIICPYSIQQRPKQVMSLEVFSKTIKDYIDIGGGDLGLTPMTGEVFLDKFLQARLDLIRSEPAIISVSAVSNASTVQRFSDARLSQLLRGFDRITVSVYGLDAEEYEVMTRKPQYERMREGVIRMLALGGAGKVVLALRHLKARAPEEVEAWLSSIAQCAGVEKIRHTRTIYYANWGVFDTTKALPFNAEWVHVRDNSRQCAMPMVSAQVLSDGTVSFCGCMDFNADSSLVLGNIRDNTLANLLATEKVYLLWNWAQNGIPEFCKTCTAHLPIEALLRIPTVFTSPLAAFGS